MKSIALNYIYQLTMYGDLCFKMMSCGSKDLLNMHPISCTNTPHDFTDIVNHEMVIKTKVWISRKWDRVFPQNKKTHNLCLKWLILRYYSFVIDVTFKLPSTKDKKWGKKFMATLEFHKYLEKPVMFLRNRVNLSEKLTSNYHKV